MSKRQQELLEISRRYAALSADKRQVLRDRLRQSGVDMSKLRMEPFRERPDRLPLSHGQERLWFLWRLEPQSGINNVSGAVRLEGELDRPALLQALRSMVARHESLRMRVEETDGVGWQVFAAAPEFELADRDLGALSTPARDAAVQAELREVAAAPFDLERGPLLRARLVRLDTRTHVLALAMHHIVSDGWSVGVLLKELSEFYAAACEGRGADLPDLPLQYGDYALWQREWLDETALSVQLDYWRARLGGDQPVLRLPADRKRRGARNTEGGRRVRAVPADLTARLRRLSQAQGATLFMTLLAAFDVLLMRYSDQRDLRVGVPMAGRLRPETAGLIGFFVNTLVIRAELTGATRFSDLLAQVRERTLEAQAHQDVPFTRLVEVLQPERSLSTTPLFQAMFNFEQGGVTAAAKLPGLVVSGLPPEVVAAQFDFTLNVLEMPDALKLSFDYAHDLFDEATIDRLSGHHIEILETVSRDAKVRIGEVGLSGFSMAAPAEYPFRAVTARIAERAAADPSREALCCEGVRLSYGELEALSNRIAHRLKRLGATADERIGLCVERSPDMVTGLLGVLKAGAAFVPLDPAYPAERLRDMIEDSGVCRVVADRATAEHLADVLRDCEIAVVTEVGDEAAALLPIELHPKQLAYVIYTSGSTGRPKGVAISHGALSLHLDDFIATYGISAFDVMLHSSTINFDVALHEILPALTMGGRVVMRGPQMWDLDRLSQMLVDEQVTFSRIPTAYWQQWLHRLPDAASLPRLRQVTVGGEGLPGDALKRWQAGTLSHIRLDNLYGPTETTIAALFRKTQATDGDEMIVPIGTPYPARSAVVLDSDGNPVPSGGFGDLCIGGESLARGYLNRPGLTAERFVPDPQGAPGSRLYRSGDLCRQRADGTIEFLGRLDQQIKLRGFRIELGEIEAVLRRCVGVKEAVAAVRGEGEGKRLIGYVVGDADPAALRAELARMLPDHMVPSELMVLPALPLMQNGKVDRTALPEPELTRTEPVEPRNSAEATLLVVWQRVLKRDDIGVTDNFFALGGDSIMSLQVIARAREAGLKLTPKQLFAHPTIAASAAVAEPVGDGSNIPEIVPPLLPGLSDLQKADLQRLGLRLNEVEDIYPATALQQGLIYHGLLQQGEGVYVNQLRFTLAGELDRSALRAAWDGAVARHAVLRTGFEWRHGGETLQIVYRQARLPHAEHDRSRGDVATYEKRLKDWRGRDLARDFDLSMPPLIRVDLFVRPDQAHDLVWTVHHALMDGWSAAQLFGDLARDYRARLTGTAPVLPVRRPYREHVAWLQRQPSAEAWWRARIASGGEPVRLTESLGRPRAAEPGTHHLSQQLDTGLSDRLRRAAQRHQVTLNTLMQGAWAIVLARFGGRRQVVFGATVSGRPSELPGVEQMLGLFINSLPVWVEVRADAAVTPWLQQLQQSNSDLRQYEHTPLAQVQQWAGRSGDTLFDTLVVFENYPIESTFTDTSGLRVVGSDVLDRTHYPLTLAVLQRSTLQLEWEWDGERVDRASVDRLASHYVEVLEALSRDAEARVGEIGLSGFSVAEPADYPFRAVTARIAEQAEADPAREALCCEGVRLSYGELETLSNRIAHRLKRLGATADERVGLCIERSPDMVAGLLGVLKAGAAFVPLDPAYPAERLRDMIEDSGVCRVVSDRATAEHLADLLRDCDIVVVTEVEAEAATPLQIELHPRQLAYVIYTSGSTGRPKGVAISHGALSLHLDDFIATYGIGASDVMLHSSTINFDVALHEILPALTMGGRVVMRGPQMWDLDRLSQMLVDEQVTFSRIPTAYWQQWLHRLPDAASLPRLRQVTVGGEGLPGDALKRWQAGVLSHIRLDNLYGPTETTIAALFRQTQASDGDEVIVPIGVPYPGRRAVVLDSDGNPVPVGGLGELCIGGESLARGYLNRPGLTAERFVPDPQGARGSRLYRSGDLCRQRADGTIEFLGRLDQQIKLRGFRIELGEIEAVLRRCVGVKEAVAVVRGEGEGKRLIGYVVGDADPAALRAELARMLPDHMVPSELMVLDTLPLMQNGKVDRTALPEPELVRAEPVAPRSDAEATLLVVWRRVLKRDDIGVTDNFFALGGDSILSLQVTARAREAGLKLTPKQLFANPTIAASAAVAEPVGGRSDIAEIAGPLPLTPIQARFFELHPDAPAHWNQAVLLRVPRELEVAALEQAVQVLVARHDALRLRFERSDGVWRQRVAAQETNALIETIELGAAPNWKERLEAEGTRLQQSLHLAKGPLLKVGYFRRAGQDGRLLIAIHHLAVDGVSWRVLLAELQQVLAQIERGEAVSLPPAGTPWSVWVTRLAEHAERPEVTAELVFWQQMLAPAENAKLPIEGDGDRSLAASQVLGFQLDAMATKRLLQDAPRAYRMRIDEVLLTALTQTLSDWSGQGGALIHLEGHGREDVIEDVDLSRTVGWFTTRYPVWLTAKADDDAAAALLDTRERLHAVPYKGIHFGLLSYLSDAANAAAIRALPRPEVSFNYLGQIDRDVANDDRFGLASESAGISAVTTSAMAHLLDLNGRVTDGVLSLSWRFSPAVISEPTVQRLVDRFNQQLRQLIDHCVEAERASNREIVASLASHLNMGVRELPGNILPLNDLRRDKTLFCLHPGYGLISEFGPLARELNGFATVYGVQSPIFSEPAWRAASFDAMAADYADRIRRIQPQGPYHLLGWSFGGRLALSIARHLEARDSDVAFVGLVDIVAPVDRIEVTEAELSRLRADLPTFLAAAREMFRSEVDQIIPGRRTPSGDLMAADEPRLIDAIVDVVAEHRKLLCDHHYPRIDSRLHLWWAAHPPKTPEDRDWRPYTADGVEHVDTLEATHATIIRHPDLAAQLRAILSKKRPASAPSRSADRVELVMEQATR